MADTLAIWKEVETTDNSQTKSFNSGTYSGTAICTHYNVKRATKLWGPMGDKWGIRIDDEQLLTDSHDPPTAVHQVRIILWYPSTTGERAEVQAYGATKFAYTSKNGRRIIDEDAAKKSMTDALGKALSYLGFSADVYMGRFDDHTYVSRDKNRQMDNEPPPNRPPPATEYRVRSAAAVRRLAGLSDRPPNLWTDTERLQVSELVESLCGEAQIATCKWVKDIPEKDLDAFCAACERREK